MKFLLLLVVFSVFDIIDFMSVFIIIDIWAQNKILWILVSYDLTIVVIEISP